MHRACINFRVPFLVGWLVCGFFKEKSCSLNQLEGILICYCAKCYNPQHQVLNFDIHAREKMWDTLSL